MTVPISPEMRDLLALHLIPGLGPRLTAALLERFGSAVAILRATSAQLQSVPHIGAKLAQDFSEAMRTVNIEAEVALLERHETNLLMLGTPEYPASLTEIPDAPHLLYIRGQVQPADARAVAIVGSRHCTAYGRRVAEQLAGGLARNGWTVISGLARGIDGAAHRAALKAGGRTIAVLAGGLSKIYPPEHAELAREIEAAGALLSESAMSLEPMAGMFPARNRLISGLSRGVVIVEAAERSGALITADHARDQGRLVFAVPGAIDNVASSGTNGLLRKGAIVVRHVDDILEDLLGTQTAPAPAVESASAACAPVVAAPPPPGMDDVQRRLWEFLGEKPRHLDEMAQQLKLAVPQIAGALMTLEMKRAVRRLPGNCYERS